jgi:hypothetical protein
MPPCYTFNKMCLPDDGMSPCAGAGVTSCPTAMWFWLTAAVIGVGLLMANSGSK